MFEDLERAISELGIPAADGEAIARALALRTRLDAVIAAAVADFDKAKLWDLDAATSMVAWLRWPVAVTTTDFTSPAGPQPWRRTAHSR